MPEVFLGIGTNLGEKAKNLASAVKEICTFAKIQRISSVYKSESMLKDGQSSYFNIVIKITTSKQPNEIFHKIKQIEEKMGRTDTGYWKERIIDIDIIDYDNIVYKDNNIEIPHPLIHKRSFVLLPLQEINPVYIHPLSGKTITELLENIEDDLNIKKLGGLHWL